MTVWYRLAGVLLLSGALGSAWAGGGFSFWSGGSSPEVLPVEDVLKLAEPVKDEEGILIEGQIAPDHYLYRHALRVVDSAGIDIEIVLPAGEARHDEFFGDTEVYTGPLLSIRLPAAVSGPLELHWQGCAERGICYPPQVVSLTLDRQMVATTTTAPRGPLSQKVALAEDQAAAARLAELGMLSGMALFFGFGVLLAFTPCTLPMIPIVSAMVVGSGARPRRAALLSSFYVLAMAGTYAVVGVIAGVAGANLQASLQSPWLLGSFAVLFLTFAASLFGAFELRMPGWLTDRIERAGRNQRGGSIAGAGTLGVLSALLVGPCMTAPLAGALLYISQTGSAVTGGLALFALGLGMGLPLVLIAVFGSRVLPRPGPWMDRVKLVFGYLMVAMAIYMLTRFITGSTGLLLWGAWMLAIAVGLRGWGVSRPAGCRGAWGLRFASVLAGLWATLMLVGAAAGGASMLKPLERLALAAEAQAAAPLAYVSVKSMEDVDARIAEAAAAGQWTMIDFYADWCVSCHVIEREVFGNPVIAERLARMQVLRPDVTAYDAADRALMQHWEVPGPPSLILIGPDGAERRAQRTVGETGVRDFAARLDAAGAP